MANLPTRTLRNYLSSLPNGASGSVLGTDLTKTTVQPARPEGYATAAQGAKADTSVQPGDLATVATSGDYDDLNGKPTLGNSAALDIASQAQAEAGVVNDKGMTPLRTRQAIGVLSVAGDGGDVTSGVQAAIDAAKDGDTLIFAPGSYTLGAVTVNKRLTIDCRQASFTLAAGTNNPMFRYTAAGSNHYGGVFDGNKANQSSGVFGIIQLEADRCAVRGAEISDAFLNGIRVRSASKCKVVECDVYDSLSNGIFAEATTADCDGVLITGCLVDRSSLDPATIVEGGIKVHSEATGTYHFKRAKIENCHTVLPASPVSGSVIGIEVWGGPSVAAAAPASFSTISGNTCDGGYMGISAHIAHSSVVANNTVEGASQTGIEVPSSEYVSVTGNAVSGSATGIITNGEAGSTGVVISANTVRACTKAIRAYLGEGVQISNNIIEHNSDTRAIEFDRTIDPVAHGNTITGTYPIGIYFIVDAVNVSAVANGNVIKGSTSAALSWSASGAGQLSFVFEANRIDNAGGNAFNPVVTGLTNRCRITGTLGNGLIPDYISYASNVQFRYNTVDPEGSSSAGKGSYCINVNGAAGAVFFVKESGTGNTGWVGK